MKKILLIMRVAMLLMSIGILQLNAAPAGDLQQKQITGKISDESGNPLPGVNIQVEGTTVGTISDLNGQYTLSVPGANAVLVYTFIGYNPQKITVGGQTSNKCCSGSISNCHAGGCGCRIRYFKKS